MSDDQLWENQTLGAVEQDFTINQTLWELFTIQYICFLDQTTELWGGKAKYEFN